MNIKDIKITLPHPSCFLLHKVIIFKRREKDRRAKEATQIRRLVELLEKVNQIDSLKEVYLRIHPKWRKRILNNLRELKEEKVIQALSD